MAKRDANRIFCLTMAALALAGAVIGAALHLATAIFPEALIAISAPRPGTAIMPTPAQRGWLLLVYSPLVAIHVVAFLSLRRTFLEGAAEQWFSRRSTRSFRLFAWGYLAAVIGQTLCEGARAYIMFGAAMAEYPEVFPAPFKIDLAAVFAALTMVVLAQMFHYGRALQEDNAAIL